MSTLWATILLVCLAGQDGATITPICKSYDGCQLTCPEDAQQKRDDAKRVVWCEEDGRRHGPMIAFHKNGQPAYMGEARKGSPWGKMLQWHANGNLFEESHWNEHGLTGVHKTWHVNGQLLAESTLDEEGHTHGSKRSWHENGQLESDADYEHGSLSERFRAWHENGKLRIESTGCKDDRCEKTTNWTGDGTKSSEDLVELEGDCNTRTLWHANGKQAYLRRHCDYELESYSCWDEAGKKADNCQAIHDSIAKTGDYLAQSALRRVADLVGQYEGTCSKETTCKAWLKCVDGKCALKVVPACPEGSSLVVESGMRLAQCLDENMKAQGPILQWAVTGVLALRGSTVNSTFDGLHETWYATGDKRSTWTLDRGKPVGPRVGWYGSGEKRWQNPYDKDGKRHGQDQEWHRNGQMAWETTYVHGVATGTESIWNEDGSILIRRQLVNGQRDGKQTVWWPNGQKRKEFSHEKGKMDGPLSCWNDAGTLVVKGEWKEDELVFLECWDDKGEKLNKCGATHRQLVGQTMEPKRSDREDP
jgi:antitoxin component YwqK of YwqJK toxin-antitoxin module